ncbi:MAG: hypothetical protein K1X75_09550 [Leptospirales bacterium]|nr:hypothetical protein [Leptospirales bacterium]
MRTRVGILRLSSSLLFLMLQIAACVRYECRATDPLCNPLAALLIYGARTFRPCQGGPTTPGSYYEYIGSNVGDSGYALCLPANGGSIVGGTSGADIPALDGQTPLLPYQCCSQNLLVSRLDDNGRVLWYGFIGSVGGSSLASITETADGGFVLVGSSSGDIPSLAGLAPLNAYAGLSDMLVAKLSSAGQPQWYTFLGAVAGGEGAYSATTLQDGTLAIAGDASANIATMQGRTPLSPYAGGVDALLCKLDSNGSLNWYTFFGSAGNDSFRGIAVLASGGMAVVGSAAANIPSFNGLSPLNPYSASNDGLLLRLDGAGRAEWFSFAGGAGSDGLSSISESSSGELLAVGTIGANVASVSGQTPLNAYAGMTDGIALSYHSAGQLAWYTILGGAGSDALNAAAFSRSDELFVAGYAGGAIAALGGKTPRNSFAGVYDMLAIQLDPSGTVQWYTMIGGAGGDDAATAMAPTLDGGLMLHGYADAGAPTIQGKTPNLPFVGVGDFDFFTARINASGDL